MPRVGNLARSDHGSATSTSLLRIPLNDDRQEKAIRLQSRQALHDLQMHKIKAAASPMRKHQAHDANMSSTPATPQNDRVRADSQLESLHPAMPNASMTPMKRMPILANFEEWMKMATDNKINATNSWNFALIDYFHDMSLLKEGDGVNFQKASCTLDGCVKIYTSRVDSVATETGKLLSGLTEGDGRKKGREHSDNADEEAADEDDESPGRKNRKKRSSESTLAPSFAPLHLKKFELEFSVDPLFKKASADFDEGGARGLLLNNLAIDVDGRLAFDSSESPQKEDGTPSGPVSVPASGQDPSTKVDVATECQDNEGCLQGTIENLGAKYFPDLDRLDAQVLCPSMQDFDVGDPSLLPGSLALNSGTREEDAEHLGVEPSPDLILDDVDDNNIEDVINNANTDAGGLGDADFPDSGEARAMHDGSGPLPSQPGEDEKAAWGANELLPASSASLMDTKSLGVSLGYGQPTNDYNTMLGFFDSLLEKNWAGPEHWRIQKVRGSVAVKAPAPTKQKPRDIFAIDFSSPMEGSLVDTIYTYAPANSSISQPRAQVKSTARNLLPDDKHFNSRDLLNLFLKPRAWIGHPMVQNRPTGIRSHVINATDAASNTDPWIQGDFERNSHQGNESATNGNYDANFFQDDGLHLPCALPGDDDDDDDFENALEDLTNAAENLDQASSQNNALDPTDTPDEPFGSRLLTHGRKCRPDYVQYAKSAKKVDVRQLKEELWKGIGNSELLNPMPPDNDLASGKGVASFTSVMQGLRDVYSQEAIKDISTSYCFICLLHLANENGLSIANKVGLEEIVISTA